MGFRDSAIAKSIIKALISAATVQPLIARILSFFRVFDIALTRFEPQVFDALQGVWKIDKADYLESFATGTSSEDGHGASKVTSVGDLGYSGSSFFQTEDSKYLIKSLPRWSEYNFFMSEMVEPYTHHMKANPLSTLVRITDFLNAPQLYLGSLLRITPSHHVIMENILYGQNQDSLSNEWETYDLKPVSYFYPERDIAGGSLASESVKERLLDTFHDKIRVREDQKRYLMDQLENDCKLLEECNVVDYSLFLVRFPYIDGDHGDRYISQLSDQAAPWRNGVPSSDNKWTYRAIVLDFFWAKHKIHAMTMTGLIASYNLFTRSGHMSITTSPSDYRERFLKMVDSLFEVTA